MFPLFMKSPRGFNGGAAWLLVYKCPKIESITCTSLRDDSKKEHKEKERESAGVITWQLDEVFVRPCLTMWNRSLTHFHTKSLKLDLSKPWDSGGFDG